MELLVVIQAVEDLLLRLIADRAGVVQDQVGRFFRLHLDIAFVLERSNDLFRVVDIHLTAEGLNIEALCGGHRSLSIAPDPPPAVHPSRRSTVIRRVDTFQCNQFKDI